MSNLLPYNEQKRILRMYRVRFVTVSIFSCVILLLAASALIFPALMLSRNTEKAIRAKRDILAGHETNTIEKNLTQTIGDINTRLAVFSDSPPASPLLQSFLDPVLKAKTAAIQITQLGFVADPKDKTHATISISGVSGTREALLSYADDLRTVDGLTTVLVPIESFLKGSNESFTITATAALK